MALILLIDTSGESGFVALSQNGKVLAVQELTDARRQAALLQPTIVEVCAAAGCKIQETEAVSVVSGPGSYTGLRVGLAAAKGICFALEIPLLMPNRLLLLGQSALAELPAGNPFWVAMPARTGEWFAGCFKGRETLVKPRHWEEVDFKEVLEYSYVKNIVLSMEKNKEITEGVIFKNLKCFIKDKVNPMHFALETEIRYDNNLFVSLVKAVPLYLKPAFTTSSALK